MEPNTIFWLGIWYVLVAAVIGSFILFFRLINMPKWRDDHGDVTSEVGYFEDPVGRVLSGPFKDDAELQDGEVAAPHVQGASQASGPY